MLGNFAPGANILRTSNPALHFRMESTDSGFYQTAVMGLSRDTTVRSERVAYVSGSRKGQSYLYWHGDRLYQLPVSYWAALGWANSPAYPDGSANFDRQIPPRCLECHATWFEAVPDSFAANRYRAARISLYAGKKGTPYTLEIRAFDDGVGYRFIVPGRDGQRLAPRRIRERPRGQPSHAFRS